MLRNAECGKTLRCNLRNIPQQKFRKIHLPKIPHSAKYTFPHSKAMGCLYTDDDSFPKPSFR